MSCANMNKNGAESKTIILHEKEIFSNSVQKHSSAFQDDEDANEDSEELFSDDAADNTVCHTPVAFDTSNKDISFLTSLKTPVLYSTDQSKTPSAASVPSAPLSLVPFLSHMNESWTSDLETPESKRNNQSVQSSTERIVQSVDNAEKEPRSIQLTPAVSIQRSVEPDYVSTSPILNSTRIRRRPKRRIFKPSPSKSLLNQRINSKTLEANDQTGTSNDFVTSINTVTSLATTIHNTNCDNGKKYVTSPKQDSKVTQEVPNSFDNKHTDVKTTEQLNASTQEFFANTSLSAIEKICEDVNVLKQESSEKSVEDRIRNIKRLQRPRRQILEHEYVAVSFDDLTRAAKLLESAATHPVIKKNEHRPHNELGLIPFSQLCRTESERSNCIVDTRETENKIVDPERNENVNIEATTGNKMKRLSSAIRESSNSSEISETCIKNSSASLSLEEDKEEADDIFREVENEVTDTQMENLGEMAMAFAEDLEEFSEWEYKSNEAVGTSVRGIKTKEMENVTIKKSYNESNCATVEKSNDTFDKPLCGFSTANGKSINISREGISAAMKLFENIEECSAEIKDLKSIGKVGKIATSGFSTANGKSISISEDKLRAAEKMYADTDGKKCLEIENGKSPLLNTKQQRSWPMLNQETHATNSSDPVERSKVTVKFKNNSILGLKRKCDFKDVNLPESSNFMSCKGFATAAGKSLAVSEKALKKAKCIFENEDLSKVLLPSNGETSASHFTPRDQLKTEEFHTVKVQKMLQGLFHGFSSLEMTLSEVLANKLKAILQIEESLKLPIELDRENINDGSDSINLEPFYGFSTADFVKSQCCACREKLRMQKEGNKVNDNLVTRIIKWNDPANVGNVLRKSTVSTEHYFLKPRSTVTTAGSSTISKKKVNIIPKEMLKITSSLLSEDVINKENVVRENQKTEKLSLGFSTASGRSVTVSKDALSRAKLLLSESTGNVPRNEMADESKKNDINTKQSENGSMAYRFSTAGGRPVNVSEEALSKAKAIFVNVDSAVTKNVFSEQFSQISDFETDIKKPMTFGFSTAGGRPVKVSEDALSKAKAIFEHIESSDTKDMFQEQLSEIRDIETDIKKPITFGFSTAGGRSVKISEESLTKAKTLFSSDLTDTPSGPSCIKSENCSSTPGNLILRNKSVSSGFKPIIKRKASEVDEDTPSGRLHLIKLKRPRLSNEFQARKLFSDVSDREIKINKMQEDAQNDKCTSVASQEEDIKENDRTMFLRWQAQKTFPIISTNINKDIIDIEKSISEKGQTVEKTLIFDEVEASTAALLEDEENSKDSTSWASKFEPKPIDVKVPHKDSSAVSIEINENPTTPIVSSTSPVLGDVDKFVSRKRSYRRSLNNSLMKENRDSSRTSFKVPYKDKSTELLSASISNHKVPYRISDASRCTNSPVSPKDLKLDNSVCNTDFSKRYKGTNQDVSTNEFVNILEKRLAASLEQERLIRMKKRNKPKPIKGSLLSRRESNKKCRISWRQITEGKPLIPRSIQELIDASISTDVLGITANTAEEYKFQCIDYYPEDLIRGNIDGFNVGDDSRLIMNNTESIGPLEFIRSFESSPGVDPALIPPGWIENHYRWIVWKLASMDRMKFGSVPMPRMLTPNRVMLELKYRYDREIDRSERPALRRILEKDDSACKRMVLCVASVTECKERLNTLNSPKNAGSSQWKLVLTDGWYSVPAAIDIAMTNYISSGKVREGTKLITYGAELLNSDQGCFPLEVPADVCLRIHTNSSRRARWDVKLGYQSNSGPITTSLKAIDPNGGLIGKMIVTVIRVYPILYREKLADGQSVFRNTRCEEKAATAYEQECQSKAEVIYAQARADLETGSQSEEREHFVERRRAMEEEVKQEVEAKLRECLPAPRQVTPLLRIRVADNDRTAILTMWSGAEEAGSILKEGSTICLRNIFASGKRAGDLQLTAGRNAIFNDINNQRNSVSSRKFTSLTEISVPGFNPEFGEFDTIGIVSSVGNAPHGMKNFETANLAYPDPDTSTSSYMSVLFWQGISSHGYSEILSVGSVVSCSNLEWRRSSSWSVPVAYCTERTIFTRNPRQSHLRQPFDDLTSRVKDPMAYAATCASEIASETMKKSIGTRTPGQGTPKKFNQDVKRTPVYSPRIAIDSPSPSTITPVKSSVAKRLEKLQWYGEPPELSPMVIHNSSNKVVQEFRPPVRTPDKP